MTIIKRFVDKTGIIAVILAYGLPSAAIQGITIKVNKALQQFALNYCLK